MQSTENLAWKRKLMKPISSSSGKTNHFSRERFANASNCEKMWWEINNSPQATENITGPKISQQNERRIAHFIASGDATFANMVAELIDRSRDKYKTSKLIAWRTLKRITFKDIERKRKQILNSIWRLLKDMKIVWNIKVYKTEVSFYILIYINMNLTKFLS